jgi:hypothetical protein
MPVLSPPGPNIVSSPVAEVEMDLTDVLDGEDGVPHGSVPGLSVPRWATTGLWARIGIAGSIAVVVFPNKVVNDY